MYILNLKPYRGAHFAEWLSLVSCVVSNVSHAIRFCYNRVIRRVCFLERIKYRNGRKQQRASTNASRENQWNEICGALFVSYSADYLQFAFKKKERKKNRRLHLKNNSVGYERSVFDNFSKLISFLLLFLFQTFINWLLKTCNLMVVIICLFKYLFHTKFNKIQMHYGNIEVIMSSKYHRLWSRAS